MAYRFAIEVASAENRAIDERIERLDTKTGVILGFVVVSVAEILGFLLLIAGEKNKVEIAHRSWFLSVFMFGLICILLAAVFGFWEMIPRNTHIGFFLRFIKNVDPSLKDEESQAQATLLSLENAAASKNDVLVTKSRLILLTVLFVTCAVCAYAVLVALLLTA